MFSGIDSLGHFFGGLFTGLWLILRSSWPILLIIGVMIALSLQHPKRRVRGR